MKKFILLMFLISFSSVSFAATIQKLAPATCTTKLKVGTVYDFKDKNGVAFKATIARVDHDGNVILKNAAGKTGSVNITNCEGPGPAGIYIGNGWIIWLGKLLNLIF